MSSLYRFLPFISPPEEIKGYPELVLYMHRAFKCISSYDPGKPRLRQERWVHNITQPCAGKHTE
jgi:hypothetical protein